MADWFSPAPFLDPFYPFYSDPGFLPGGAGGARNVRQRVALEGPAAGAEGGVGGEGGRHGRRTHEPYTVGSAGWTRCGTRLLGTPSFDSRF